MTLYLYYTNDEYVFDIVKINDKSYNVSTEFYDEDKILFQIMLP